MRNKIWISLCVTLGLVAGGLPAQASEVVKLARLVVIGKRTAAEPARTPPAEQTRSPAAGAQTHSGGGDDNGTAPAPVRGIS